MRCATLQQRRGWNSTDAKPDAFFSVERLSWYTRGLTWQLRIVPTTFNRAYGFGAWQRDYAAINRDVTVTPLPVDSSPPPPPALRGTPHPYYFNSTTTALAGRGPAVLGCGIACVRLAHRAAAFVAPKCNNSASSVDIALDLDRRGPRFTKACTRHSAEPLHVPEDVATNTSPALQHARGVVFADGR